MLKRVFYVKKAKNVPFFYTSSKDLRDFTTTEKDMKKDLSRFPTPNFRTNDEDLFDSSANESMVSNASAGNEGGVFGNAASGEEELVAQ